MSGMSNQGTPQTPEEWQRYWQDQGRYESEYTRPAPPGAVAYGLRYETDSAYATWGSRVAAAFIDSFYIFAVEVVAIILALMLEGDNALLFAYGLGFLVFLWFQVLNGLNGQTPGKRRMQIKVVHKDTGLPIGGLMGLVRYLAGFGISVFTCGIGGLLDVLWPLWEGKKRTLHDMVVGSVVIDVRQIY